MNYVRTSQPSPQRLAIYETLVAQTRPLWVGEVSGRGAVLEHLEYRNGTIRYRDLLGGESSVPFEEMNTAIAWLANRDSTFPFSMVSRYSNQVARRQTPTACGTGTYYVLDYETQQIGESYFVPMALTPERIRVDFINVALPGNNPSLT